jgi:hypothetical protein
VAETDAGGKTTNPSASKPRPRRMAADLMLARFEEYVANPGNAAVHTTILRTGSESPDDGWAFCLGGIRAPA